MTAPPAPRRWVSPHAAVYRPEEVAELFRVDSRTVARWAALGRIPQDKMFRTPGGHRRYNGDYIRSMLNGGQS